MSSNTDTPDPIAKCIRGLQEALRNNSAQGQPPPVERRKLRTLVSECGRKRGTPAVLEQIAQRFQEAGLYFDCPVSDSSLRPDDYVWISTGPFPPDAMLFPREADLRKFVLACLGSGAFRQLEPLKGQSKGLEFSLPDGSRVDLLCQERAKSGAGALVAIEFKRDHQRGTIEQLIGYIEQLKVMFPGRPVKGIVISGREDQALAARLPIMAQGYDIRWFCYQVSFDPTAASTV